MSFGGLLKVPEERIAAIQKNGWMGLMSTIGIRLKGTTTPPAVAGLDFLTYGNGLTSDLAQLGQYYRAGDGFYLSSGNFGGTFNLADVEAWLATLKDVVPGGARFAAQTGGTPNAQDLATIGLPSDIPWISMDWEPSEPGFDKTQAGTLSILKTFAAYVHAHGYRAIAYLSGQGINGDQAVDQWDYGALYAGSGIDWITVETQGLEGVAGGKGPQVVQELASQMKAAGGDVSKLECQATVGSTAGGHPVTTQMVVDTYNAAIATGQVRFFLEFAGSTYSDLIAVLQALGR